MTADSWCIHTTCFAM